MVFWWLLVKGLPLQGLVLQSVRIDSHPLLSIFSSLFLLQVNCAAFNSHGHRGTSQGQWILIEIHCSSAKPARVPPGSTRWLFNSPCTIYIYIYITHTHTHIYIYIIYILYIHICVYRHWISIPDWLLDKLILWSHGTWIWRLKTHWPPRPPSCAPPRPQVVPPSSYQVDVFGSRPPFSSKSVRNSGLGNSKEVSASWQPALNWRRENHLYMGSGQITIIQYNSLTWIKAIWGWFPLSTRIPVRSQWGRYNLHRWDGQKKQPRNGMVSNTVTPPVMVVKCCEWDGLWHWICHNWKCNFKIFKDMRMTSHILVSDESNATSPLEPLWFEHISGILVDWIALNPNKEYVRCFIDKVCRQRVAVHSGKVNGISQNYASWTYWSLSQAGKPLHVDIYLSILSILW